MSIKNQADLWDQKQNHGGGLSESEYVQKSMQTAFPDINVMIPEDPELAVMEGAVLFGFNPSVITRIGSENM